tara:strand:+ start:5332 stop:6579 length:1248 start_codon:yes stop_codon:yes gene_type:complete
MNKIIKNILIGFSAIRSSFTRVFLTSIGLTIGIFTVSIVTAAVSSVDREFAKSIQSIGNDKIYVGRMPWSFEFDWWNYRNRPEIKEESLDYINQYSEYVTQSSMKQNYWTKATYENKASWLQMNGVYPNYNDMMTGTKVVNGRFFSENEWKLQRRVAIIGGSVGEGFFDGEDPIGKKIRLGGVSFEVIGELEKTGSFTPTGSLDQVIIMPTTTFQRILTRWTWNEFVLQIDPNNREKAKEEVRMIMRVARKLKPDEEDNFAVNSADAFTKQFNQMKIAIAGMGLLVTSISLIVSGIGIMNVMFVSVRERTKEIGLRKAMGATNSDILTQFLSEAIAIAIIGGTMGILLIRTTLYFIGSAIANIDINGMGSAIDLQMDLLLTFYTFMVCVFLGLIAGMVPARTAAKLNPIDALRHE